MYQQICFLQNIFVTNIVYQIVMLDISVHNFILQTLKESYFFHYFVSHMQIGHIILALTFATIKILITNRKNANKYFNIKYCTKLSQYYQEILQYSQQLFYYVIVKQSKRTIFNQHLQVQQICTSYYTNIIINLVIQFSIQSTKKYSSLRYSVQKNGVLLIEIYYVYKQTLVIIVINVIDLYVSFNILIQNHI
eukprot:TRINITY_DN328_c1_g1_i5.p2 TRINITY_DN328_c1_g1~~TRINITY_DN328_c1_g1_i5.p2  ORF type:complete len:193 (+),score=-31.81 TRINITY_DN328_c1_g1_i5:162-740(+)